MGLSARCRGFVVSALFLIPDRNTHQRKIAKVIDCCGNLGDSRERVGVILRLPPMGLIE
jgi:hypothetical protein